MKKILLYEDDPDIQKSLKSILKKHGYEAHIAPDGEEAIAMAIKVNPDVILLDIRIGLANKKFVIPEATGCRESRGKP